MNANISTGHFYATARFFIPHFLQRDLQMEMYVTMIKNVELRKVSARKKYSIYSTG
jgi:hypothetical protein